MSRSLRSYLHPTSHASCMGSFARLLGTVGLAALAAGASASAQAVLVSDQADYQPGTTATLSGAGFAADESVRMLVVHADGSPSTGADHDPWDVTADSTGAFTTTWHVCEDDCVGETLVATADGQSSGLHAEITFTDAVGTGYITVTSSTSCVDSTDPAGAGPGNWEVVQGGSYTMTIAGVTECTGSTITVFVQSSDTGNFCFNASGGSGTYVGTFTMPTPACNTYPVSYKCGANAPCNNAATFAARYFSDLRTNVAHLRASNFDGSCNKTSNDTDCTSGCSPCRLVCPPSVSIDCTASTDPSNTGTPTGCTGATFSDTVTAGNCAGNFAITRHWSAPDGCGGTSTCDQTITVTDTTGPSISCPGNVSIDCSASTDPSSTGSASATDDCSGVADIHYSDSNAPGNCAGNLVITRTWTATDACGNSSSCAQTITVTDTTGPSISCPGNVSIDCSASTDPSSTGSASATDDCSGVANVSYSDSVNQPNASCASRVITRTWTATDGCGNSSSCAQTITVTDTTAPTISCPANVTANGRGACCIPVNIGTASATDDCSGATVTSNAPAQFCVGTTTVTWTATDGCGNASTCTQTVTVYGQICATKFYDTNADGVRNFGEVGVANWPIAVNPGNLAGTTDANGTVCFAVPAGNYTVSEGTSAGNWVHTTATSYPVVVGDSPNCNPSVAFGNYCYSPPSNGLTLGFWSNSNGQRILTGSSGKLLSNTLLLPSVVTLLNNPCGTGAVLRDASGSIHTFTNSYSSFRTWLLSANASNMANMLSAQLAANVLDEAFNGLNGSTGVVVPGKVTTLASVCIVPFLSVTQPITCGSSALVSLTSVPSTGACNCTSNNGLVTIDDLQNRACCLLAAYGNTTPASTQRTYQECVKDILDMINNNGNPTGSSAYPCGGVSQYINPPGTCTF
ncbi:MAG: HYR domain-containing protein [Planctomycetes bacterium]|nr:HYR domain-containing protein [Planctomycetota bacterium]